jgi:hypothetical protein
MPLAMVCCVAKESFELMLRAERLRLEAPQRVMVWWLHMMVGWLTRKGEERDKLVESMRHLFRPRIVQKRKKDQVESTWNSRCQGHACKKNSFWRK